MRRSSHEPPANAWPPPAFRWRTCAIGLTHLNRDHFTPAWFAMLRQFGIRVFCHEGRSRELKILARDRDVDVEICEFNSRPFEPVEGVTFRAISLDHDELGSHGFLIHGFGRCDDSPTGNTMFSAASLRRNLFL